MTTEEASVNVHGVKIAVSEDIEKRILAYMKQADERAAYYRNKDYEVFQDREDRRLALWIERDAQHKRHIFICNAINLTVAACVISMAIVVILFVRGLQ